MGSFSSSIQATGIYVEHHEANGFNEERLCFPPRWPLRGCESDNGVDNDKTTRKSSGTLLVCSCRRASSPIGYPLPYHFLDISSSCPPVSCSQTLWRCRSRPLWPDDRAQKSLAESQHLIHWSRLRKAMPLFTSVLAGAVRPLCCPWTPSEELQEQKSHETLQSLQYCLDQRISTPKRLTVSSFGRKNFSMEFTHILSQ